MTVIKNSLGPPICLSVHISGPLAPSLYLVASKLIFFMSCCCCCWCTRPCYCSQVSSGSSSHCHLLVPERHSVDAPVKFHNARRQAALTPLKHECSGVGQHLRQSVNGIHLPNKTGLACSHPSALLYWMTLSDCWSTSQLDHVSATASCRPCWCC